MPVYYSYRAVAPGRFDPKSTISQSGWKLALERSRRKAVASSGGLAAGSSSPALPSMGAAAVGVDSSLAGPHTRTCVYRSSRPFRLEGLLNFLHSHFEVLHQPSEWRPVVPAGCSSTTSVTAVGQGGTSGDDDLSLISIARSHQSQITALLDEARAIACSLSAISGCINEAAASEGGTVPQARLAAACSALSR